MTLCILAAGKTTAIAATAFTLSWTHSVQKTEWRESWELTPAGLHLVEARVRGSGAGMEPPTDAKLTDGWWIYRPNLKPQPTLVLAASGATSGGWTLCAGSDCREVGKSASEPVVLSACEASGSSQPR